ncbi:hypothetical protein MNBD_ALPHA11-1139 [hydrothermal vent metagenome]|uniref:HTH marR-type domain-containing protein n=1 Tax=hydrothermal vent metagenome TaxID=652676 RepID=A0A3B0TKM4_9ZZZZ
MEETSLQNNIRQNLFELLFLVQEKMREVVRGLDDHISPGQVLILRTLVEQGPMSQRALGEALSRDKSQIARLVQGLEASELVTREQSRQDRRVFIVKACPPVLAKISGFVLEEKALVTKMLAGITEKDQIIFCRVLAKMSESI